MREKDKMLNGHEEVTREKDVRIRRKLIINERRILRFSEISSVHKWEKYHEKEIELALGAELKVFANE